MNEWTSRWLMECHDNNTEGDEYFFCSFSPATYEYLMTLTLVAHYHGVGQKHHV